MLRQRRGILAWLTNHLTYEQKYSLAGLVRAIGYLIFWISLLLMVMNQISLVKAQLSSSETQTPLRKLYQSVIDQRMNPNISKDVDGQIQSLIRKEEHDDKNETFVTLKQLLTSIFAHRSSDW